MIISDSEQFVFLHNPKAAGTSVRVALLPYETRRNTFWGIELDSTVGWNVDKAHLPIHVLSRLYPGVRQLLGKYFTFGFTRHPLGRFVSAFNERHPQDYQGLIEGRLALGAYKKRLEGYAEEVVAGGRWNPSFTHATPQKPLFFDGRKCVADLLIPVESPLPRVQSLAEFMGAAGAAVAECFEEQGRHHNVRRMAHGPDDLLSSRVTQLLHDFYQEDFLTLGYPF